MGKGDKRTKRGKINRASYGKNRKRKVKKKTKRRARPSDARHRLAAPAGCSAPRSSARGVSPGSASGTEPTAQHFAMKRREVEAIPKFAHRPPT